MTKPSSKVEPTKPSASYNNSNTTSHVKNVENAETGEGANTLPWLAFIASSLTIGLAVVLNKLNKLKGKLF